MRRPEGRSRASQGGPYGAAHPREARAYICVSCTSSGSRADATSASPEGLRRGHIGRLGCWIWRQGPIGRDFWRWPNRSEESRVGEEGGSKVRAWWVGET